MFGVGSALLLWLVSQALWLIPTWQVSKRPGFQALRASVMADRGFAQALRGPIEADAFPESYTIGDGVERYTVIVAGADGVIRVAGEVRDGKVVHQQSSGIATWSSAWDARKRRQSQAR
ncbi:MAG: hypothetical protein JKY65_15430 [Planctomycetes bacterium]|nr:hypothetical protein [Planctomycetota bacterium]